MFYAVASIVVSFVALISWFTYDAIIIYRRHQRHRLRQGQRAVHLRVLRFEGEPDAEDSGSTGGEPRTQFQLVGCDEGDSSDAA
jgi:hypothetical protein